MAGLVRHGIEGVMVFECFSDDSNDVNLFCICSFVVKASLERGSRAEAVEHAAFCLRGREVSSIAVFGVRHE